MVVPKPFSIRVADDVLADLRERLARARWPDAVPGGGWSYGTDLAYMRELVAYWRDRYDWRAHERVLNGFRQFTLPIAGIDVHFLHWPYYAFHHTPWRPSAAERVTVPTGHADFPREILRPPLAWAERAYNITRWTTMPAGGHFAALEEPDLLADDVRAFLRPLR